MGTKGKDFTSRPDIKVEDYVCLPAQRTWVIPEVLPKFLRPPNLIDKSNPHPYRLGGNYPGSMATGWNLAYQARGGG